MRFLTLLLVIMLMACKSPGQKNNITKENNQVEVTKQITLTVKGMTCTGCENTIKSCISELEGTGSVQASHTEGTAVVNFNPQETDTIAIKKAVTEAGYAVTGISIND